MYAGTKYENKISFDIEEILIYEEKTYYNG